MGFVVAALVLGGYADIALRRTIIGTRTAWPDATALLLWPPFLAAIPAVLIITPMYDWMTRSAIDGATIHMSSVGITALLTAVFAFLYARLLDAYHHDARSVIFMIPVVQTGANCFCLG